jgi:hypothetical protein
MGTSTNAGTARSQARKYLPVIVLLGKPEGSYFAYFDVGLFDSEWQMEVLFDLFHMVA